MGVLVAVGKGTEERAGGIVFEGVVVIVGVTLIVGVGVLVKLGQGKEIPSTIASIDSAESDPTKAIAL